MDGVTILNEIEVVTRTAGEFNDCAAGIAILISIIICALVGFFIGREDCSAFEGLIIGALMGVFAGIFVGAAFGSVFAGPATFETKIQYEVILDDSVSMNEFCDKYTIIEQRGEIFVVKEKEK